MVTVGPLLELAPNWRSFLARVIRDEDIKLLRSHEQTGRPLGDDEFLANASKRTCGRILKNRNLAREGRGRTIKYGIVPGTGEVWCPRELETENLARKTRTNN